MNRQISKSIVDILESKIKLGCKISKSVTENKWSIINEYVFTRKGRTFKVYQENYKSNGIAYYAIENDVLLSKEILLECYDLVKKIIIPTDKNLLEAMSNASKRSFSTILAKYQ